MARWAAFEKWRSTLVLYRLRRETRASGSSLVRMAENEAPESYGLHRRISAVVERREDPLDPLEGYNDLEQFRYASMLLCELPDDALDVAESYITDGADHLGDHVISAGQFLALDVGMREIELGVWTLGLEVQAMNTPHFREVETRTEQLRGRSRNEHGQPKRRPSRRATPSGVRGLTSSDGSVMSGRSALWRCCPSR